MVQFNGFNGNNPFNFNPAGDPRPDPTITDILPGLNPQTQSPPGVLGVAPVRLLAAGEGKMTGPSSRPPMLVLRLLAREHSTGLPARLDLAFSWEDAMRLKQAATLLLDRDPPCACGSPTCGRAKLPPSGGPGASAPSNPNPSDN